MVISVNGNLAKGFVRQNVAEPEKITSPVEIKFTQNTTVQEEVHGFSEVVMDDIIPSESAENDTVNSNPALEFDYNNYNQLNNTDKIAHLTTELAHNRFLYSNNKTESDWQNLSDEEKQALGNIELRDIVNLENNPNFSEQSVAILLNEKMTLLQTANANKEFFADFLDKKPEERQRKVLDYLNEVNLVSPEKLSSKQSQFLVEHNSILETLYSFLQEIIIQNPSLKDELGQYVKELSERKISEEDVDTILKQLAQKGIKKTRNDLVLESLKNKLDKNLGTEEDAQRYKRLQAIKALSLMENKATDNGKLKALLNDNEFGNLYSVAKTSTDKVAVLSNYIDKDFDKLSAKDKANGIIELVQDIHNSNDDETAQLLLTMILSKNQGTELEEFLANDERLMLQNAVGINNYSRQNKSVIARAQLNAFNNGINRNFARACATTSLELADEDTFDATSEIYSGFKDEKVEEKHAEIALNSERIKNPEIQMRALSNINNNSMDSVRVKTATQLDKAHAENQLRSMELFIQKKDANDAMIEAGTFTRFSPENQLSAFKMHKSRAEKEDYSKDDAIKTLNTLSDWISTVENTETQLAMHSEIMTSKYSEVQEHASANIKNYNPSIQSKALDIVYQSKNQNAINKAVENLLLAPECIQQEEFSRVICEFAISTQNVETEGFLGGNLSINEINKLSPAKRKIYFAKLFTEASISEKMKLLKNLPSRDQKKTIFTMIAKFSPNLLREMIDSGMGFEMLSFNLPVDATSRIIAYMKEMASDNRIKEQLKDLQKDKGYQQYFVADFNRQSKNLRLSC